MPLNFGGLLGVSTVATRNFSIVKLEWPSVRYYVPSGAVPFSANGEAVPWSWRSEEIARKAFLVRIDATSADDGTGFAYLFLDQGGNICQAPYNGGAPVYESRNVAFHGDGMGIVLHNDRVEVNEPRFKPE